MSYDPKMTGDKMARYLAEIEANARRATGELESTLRKIGELGTRPTLNPITLAEALAEAQHHAGEALRYLEHVEGSAALAERIRKEASAKSEAAQRREDEKRESEE